jgi:hypothetical protein
MAELQAEIVIRLMSDGKVAAKWTKIGPMGLYGMLEITKDMIRKEQDREVSGSVIAPASQLPRIMPGDIPPLMGNGK